MSLPRYPKYKDSGVEWLGDVPEHWEAKPLKALATMNDDVLPETTEPDYKIDYVDIGSVSLESGIEKTETFVFANAPSRARRKTLDGDVLVSTVRTYLKAICAIKNPAENLVVSTGFAVVRPRIYLHPSFAQYALQSSGFVNEVIARSTGVSYPAINPSELGRIYLSTPPLSEQSVVATFLDRETAKIDALVEEQRRLIELLKEKRQAVISHAVTKGLNPHAKMKPSGIEWLGQMPAHWKNGALTRVASRVVVGIAEAATHAYVDNGIPILRSTNIRAGRIIGEVLMVDSEFASERGSKEIRSGDLITVRTGNAGVTAVIPPALDGCQCFTMLITSLCKTASPEFYCYYLNGDIAQKYFSIEGWGTAQVNISVPILKTLPVPIPPTEEQAEIVSFLDIETAKLDALRTEANRAIDLLQERRTALISAAVTGKIDVRGEHHDVQ